VEARKPYEIRILVLGGSTAWGLGASSTEATVPGALERILNRTGSTGSYRVMSGAFSGWAGRQERVAAVELFGVFQPDLVVALTGYNDVLGMVDGSSHVFLQRPEAAELGRAVEDQLRPMTTWRALRKLGGTLGVWRLVVYVREAVTVGNPTGGRTAYDPSIAAQEIPRLVDLYTDLAGFLDRRGRRLLVALQPDLYSARKPLTEEEQGVRRRFVSRAPDFEPTFRRYREELVSALLAARGNGFSALDLGGVFDAHAGPVFIDDCHFNDEGYRVIAEALAQPIRAAR
jgi:lysophospholipase L1-like esterase